MLEKTLDQACSEIALAAQYAFKVSMIHWVVQFTLRIAVRSVLHRYTSQEIHRWKSSDFFLYWFLGMHMWCTVAHTHNIATTDFFSMYIYCSRSKRNKRNVPDLLLARERCRFSHTCKINNKKFLSSVGFFFPVPKRNEKKRKTWKEHVLGW